jgi:hypothetical protein
MVVLHSKPSYCSKVSDLQASVKDLGNVDLSSRGVSALQSQLKKVKSSANAVVSSAKSDFSNETSAMWLSLNTAMSQAGSSPSASQVAANGVSVKGVVTAVDGFASATSSKCS